ncbi:Asp-tRNA(Asn)/Glu-tRNA(Gln) amidotransferase subunit GatA [Fonticella tunisiensis]|uniref:Glutamyl-tRNA(Gln) amidotransferase subunit A n=1 Tax=Fonticella tunisiensis TaxID=1096341 RepID=A0A4R7KSL5_9CLOT|nr:Asp-tRNA(Asn)/Glu-tRNA(Gln) amidotransferase subunit GatA [Fonticella tunisiensis]TDT58409.1 aspartyl/glutamyl-tRNA(Asn/Gln) amidotransferase subunit A [Fonticella tunisiensis]
MHKKTVHEIRDLLRRKEISSVELTKIALERINSIDDRLGAFISVYGEQALEAAKDVDRKIASGEELPDLAGIPTALKDNMNMKGTKTTCASRMLENFVSPYDAGVTERLKENGAVIIGKTNMDEFAMGSSNETSYFKKVRNPYDLERVPGGSSGGSAAAVASGEVYYSLGSDTGGSIRQPAAMCGVVGLKPTYGRVSRYGLVAFASSLDQIGPFTKDVEDCAIVLNAISGKDERDSTSADVKVEDFTKYLNRDIRGMRIGMPVEFFGEGISEDVRKIIIDAVEVFKSQGAEVKEISLPMSRYALEVYYILASSEASSNLARFDGIRYGYRAESYSDAVDIYTKSRSQGFGDEVKRRIMLGTYALSAGYYDAYYKKALQIRTLIINEFKEAYKNVDIILSPTSPTTAFKLGEKINDPLSMYLSDIYTVPVNIAGIPAISIPAGLSNGLPVGLQLMGNYFEEGTLLKAAHAFERATEHHRIRPSI